MDHIFQEEQAHLQEMYQKLLDLKESISAQLDEAGQRAEGDLKNLAEEVRLDFGGADETMESLAAIETLNAVIDSYNQYHDFTVEKLSRLLLLLEQPYFAKVQLELRPGRPARDVYIGVAGLMDEHKIPLIVDWRNPIAETYYSQDLGPTTYEVDGRVKQANLKLRRQFDLARDQLFSYFDSTVAIQDSLLLQTLKRQQSEKMCNITSTIQREQNAIIRHDDTPALLVKGSAGSGKTSVMLQRIAYLMYKKRATLSADQVWLISPNKLFSSYIDQVLPSMGEKNPHTLTWKEFAATQSVAHTKARATNDLELMSRMDEAAQHFNFDQKDFYDLTINDVSILKAHSFASALEKFERFGLGAKRLALATEELHTRASARLSNLAKDEDVQEEMLGLDIEDQLQIFGEIIAPNNDEEILELAKRYVEHLYGSAHDEIDRLSWINYQRICQRLAGENDPSMVALLYCRYLVSRNEIKDAQYLMLDEVQDLSPAQLKVLALYFRHARVCLLGDPNQAISEASSSWDEIRAIFAETHGEVAELALKTSYRSSPEISELFAALGEDAGGALEIQSVREGGEAVELYVLEDEAASSEHYVETLQQLIEKALTKRPFVAVVVESKARAAWLKKALGEHVKLVSEGSELPKEGVAVIHVELAKGLEFEQVILADAQAEVYGDDELSRKLLYTAVSRAMHRLYILSQGSLSPHLARALKA